MNNTSRKWLFYALGILMIVNTSAFAANEMTQPKTEIGGDFTLTDHNNNRFELQQLRGKVVMLFFGYTHCPDICPTELASMAKILKQIDSDKVSALFITVDPQRDTVEKLKNYVPFFSPKLIGLTGTPAEINKVTKAYKVQSKIHAPKENSDYYLVDHSANLYLIDEQGKLANMIPFGLPSEHILNVIQQSIPQE